MMRSGRLLAEESPANLLGNYGFSTLEDVFLKLCMKDGNTKVKDAMILSASNSNETNFETSRKHPRHGGHDNMAFNFSKFDVSHVAIDRKSDIKNNLGSLAHYNAVSTINF